MCDVIIGAEEWERDPPPGLQEELIARRAMQVPAAIGLI